MIGIIQMLRSPRIENVERPHYRPKKYKNQGARAGKLWNFKNFLLKYKKICSQFMHNLHLIHSINGALRAAREGSRKRRLLFPLGYAKLKQKEKSLPKEGEKEKSYGRNRFP